MRHGPTQEHYSSYRENLPLDIHNGRRGLVAGSASSSSSSSSKKLFSTNSALQRLPAWVGRPMPASVSGFPRSATSTNVPTDVEDDGVAVLLGYCRRLPANSGRAARVIARLMAVNVINVFRPLAPLPPLLLLLLDDDVWTRTWMQESCICYCYSSLSAVRHCDVVHLQ